MDVYTASVSGLAPPAGSAADAEAVVPGWLHILSIAALRLGGACAIVIGVDELRESHMWIMNVVWSVTVLFGTVITLWGYFRYGRLATHVRAQV
jgi:hypothetical protein